MECEVFWVDELRHLSAADVAGAYEYVNPCDYWGRRLIFMNPEIEKNIAAVGPDAQHLDIHAKGVSQRTLMMKL